MLMLALNSASKCTVSRVLTSAQRPRGGALPAQTRLPDVSARLSDDRELRHAPAHAARFVATNAAAADSSVNTGSQRGGRGGGDGGACLRRWGIGQL